MRRISPDGEGAPTDRPALPAPGSGSRPSRRPSAFVVQESAISNVVADSAIVRLVVQQPQPHDESGEWPPAYDRPHDGIPPSCRFGPNKPQC